jgi:anti-sigma regulatory factor (Ser/Thr protein kinase)
MRMTQHRRRRGWTDRVNLASQEQGDRVEWALEPGDIAAVPRLRRQIMRQLRAIAAPGADLDAAEIVVGELLGNALSHTSGSAWVSLRWDGAHPLLSVADIGPGFPGLAGSALVDERRTLVPRLPSDPLAEGGRGLYLVAQLALDVAVAPRSTGGTVVSVTLDLKRAS